MKQDVLKDRYRGCLIGGAAGDALGYPIEFAQESSIFQKYGKSGLTEYALFDKFDRAIVTDDTQMTLFTANGLLCCAAHRLNGEAAEERESIRKAYLDWLYTQAHPVAPHPFRGQQTGTLPDAEAFSSRLMEIPWLFARRAPGNTCLSALESGGNGSFEKPLNHSKGCGGVMRTAPAGLFAETPEEALRIGAEAGVLTHGHPLGYIPAGGLSYIVWLAVHTDRSLKQIAADSIDAAEAYFSGIPAAAEYLPEYRAIMEHAISLAADRSYDDLAAIHELGEGWVGEEAIAIAVYCALRHSSDFKACLTAAVNHNGDSDSTGAIAGNILGARLGLSAIPAELLEKLEGVSEITEIADDLCMIGQADESFMRKYLR